MFIDPIINEMIIEKEVSAVDSEYEMHLQDDLTMAMDVIEAHMISDHPFSMFSCGNKNTLFNNFKNHEFLTDLIMLFR